MTHLTPTGNQFNRERVLHDGAGVTFRPPSGNPNVAGGKDKQKWISDEEINRNKLFFDNWMIYEGNHLDSGIEGLSGPFKHPYDRDKVISEGIDYVIMNVLGEITDRYAALVMGEEFKINTDTPAMEEILESIHLFKETICDAVVQASVFGWVGLLPTLETIEKTGEKKISISIIDPAQLRINWFSARNEIHSIDKMIRFDDPTQKPQESFTVSTTMNDDIGYGISKGVSGQPEILLLERHFRGRYETRLLRIQGQFIVEELDLGWFSEHIDESVTLKKSGETGLKDFQISILANDRIRRHFKSDYSPPAKILQKQINNRMTQEARILDIHSSPKLMLPIGAAQRDPDTGRAFVDMQGRDVFFVDEENGTMTPQYLTWDGQLEAARKQKLNILQALLTTTKMAPSLLSFTDIMNATSADTFSKMRLNLQTTLKTVERKRSFLEKALDQVLKNVFIMSGVSEDKADDFEVFFPDPIPTDRSEDVNEAVTRKQNHLISSRTAIQTLDDLTDEQADEEYARILEEVDRENSSSGLGGFGSEGPGMSDEELDERILQMKKQKEDGGEKDKDEEKDEDEDKKKKDEEE